MQVQSQVGMLGITSTPTSVLATYDCKYIDEISRSDPLSIKLPVPAISHFFDAMLEIVSRNRCLLTKNL